MRKWILLACAVSALSIGVAVPTISAEPPQTEANAATKQVGTIRSIAGKEIVLTTDAGTQLKITIAENARILRLAPGQTNLRDAVPLELTSLAVGDRVLVRGTMTGDALAATTVVAMKREDIAQKQQHELMDWQRRGVGGLVKSVDPIASTVTISTMSATGPKDTLIHVPANVTIRRYAPDSIRFDDATPAKLADIKAGDQLRARGQKNADGTEVTAEEIVAGTFRNIAGTVSSVDSQNNTITVQDLASKKSVTVRISDDSQMKKLPQQLAQGIAMRFKHAQGGDRGNSEAPSGAAMGARPQGSRAPDQAAPPAEGHRSGDLNQLLSRLPAAKLSDLAKGDAVMIVTTQGSDSKAPTVITLLGGVEPILTASPNGGSASSLLSPWSLASAPAEAAGPQ